MVMKKFSELVESKKKHHMIEWWYRITGWAWRWDGKLKPKTWYRIIKRGTQRWRRGWSDEDVWGFDTYLASVLAGGLKRLAGHHHGVPMEFSDRHDGDVDKADV